MAFRGLQKLRMEFEEEKVRIRKILKESLQEGNGKEQER